MAEKKFIAVVLVCVVLSVGVIGAVMILNQKNIELQLKGDQISGLENEKVTLEAQVLTLQTEKVTLETQISSLKSETNSLNNEKSALETQVSSIQSEVTVLENEKDMLEAQVVTLQTEKLNLGTQVANLQSETTSLNNEVITLEAQVSSLQSDVTSLESEVIESFNLGYVEGESDGYQIGYYEGYVQGVEDGAGSGWYLRDPTYDEVIAFIDLDKTDENEYTADYVCYDFTADFNGNAFQTGYMCGFVYIEFFDGAHSITCFNTTDRGLIYVEPQTDEIVTVAIGQLYSGHIIVDLGIIW